MGKVHIATKRQFSRKNRRAEQGPSTEDAALSPQSIRDSLEDDPPTPPSAQQILREMPVTGAVLDHPQLRTAIRLTRLAHEKPGLVMWTGEPGTGKTIAAMQLAYECDTEVAAGKPGAYGARYFQTGGDVYHGSNRQMKRGLQALYEALGGELTPAGFRNASEQQLADDVVQEAKMLGIQIILVDEAGTKTAAELRGFGFVCDRAREIGWPLTIVVLGMDDLAAKMTSLAVLESRTRATFYFSAWNEAACGQFLVTQCSGVARLAESDPRAAAVLVRAVMLFTGGRPREVETLVPEIELRLKNGAPAIDGVMAIIKWRSQMAAQAIADAARYKLQR